MAYDPNSVREVRTLHVAEGEDGVRLDRWFKRRWPHLSHIQIQKLAPLGPDPRRRRAGPRPTPGWPPAPRCACRPCPTRRPPTGRGGLSPRDIAYAAALVLYEDDDVLALNKPAGLAVQGGTKTTHHIDRLLSAWGEGLERPRLVHRLDRDTSGVLLLGKSPARGRQAGRRLRPAARRRRPTGPSSPARPSRRRG